MGTTLRSATSSAPWIDAVLNHARTELFLAALELHEQFVCQNAPVFIRNLSRWVDMVKGDWGDLKEREIVTLWKTFFLVVPVVSTTFASIQRLFFRVPPASLGWVLIDEAGQGVPQAAVGALQRVQRAVVVGDPLQIEPVFTLDKALTKGIQDYCAVEDVWSPVAASIQTLSDRANSYGTRIEGTQDALWIGCPLWVHRRCVQPMFEISNRIAYEGRMVSATLPPQDKHFPLGESRWIDVEGQCQGRHWVPDQGEVVIKMLAQLMEGQNKLPNVYVISPFKNVAQCLRTLLKQRRDRWIKGKPALEDWLKRSVGTVHTFQGKEADTVIFVLGADDQSRGAVAWASGAPNILNVAVTRAKYRFYVVGSKRVWAGLQYFKVASTRLDKPKQHPRG